MPTISPKQMCEIYECIKANGKESGGLDLSKLDIYAARLACAYGLSKTTAIRAFKTAIEAGYIKVKPEAPKVEAPVAAAPTPTEQKA